MSDSIDTPQHVLWRADRLTHEDALRLDRAVTLSPLFRLAFTEAMSMCSAATSARVPDQLIRERIEHAARCAAGSAAMQSIQEDPLASTVSEAIEGAWLEATLRTVGLGSPVLAPLAAVWGCVDTQLDPFFFGPHTAAVEARITRAGTLTVEEAKALSRAQTETTRAATLAAIPIVRASSDPYRRWIRAGHLGADALAASPPAGVVPLFTQAVNAAGSAVEAAAIRGLVPDHIVRDLEAAWLEAIGH